VNRNGILAESRKSISLFLLDSAFHCNCFWDFLKNLGQTPGRFPIGFDGNVCRIVDRLPFVADAANPDIACDL
jgi:hypothetical protein